MKTLYTAMTSDYGYQRSYGTFETREAAQAMADRVNAFEKRTEDDSLFTRVIEEYVVEASDQVFTHRATYHVEEDLSNVGLICPTMFDESNDMEWLRGRFGEEDQYSIQMHIIMCGHSEEHALLRLNEVVEQFKAEGRIQRQRERYVARMERIAEAEKNGDVSWL